MIQLYDKATNRSTDENVYEGLKKSYFNYEEAFEIYSQIIGKSTCIH